MPLFRSQSGAFANVSSAVRALHRWRPAQGPWMKRCGDQRSSSVSFHAAIAVDSEESLLQTTQVHKRLIRVTLSGTRYSGGALQPLPGFSAYLYH